MIDEAAAFDDRPVGNNATYQLDNPFDYRQDIVRLDYRFNDEHSIYGRYLHDKYDLIEPLGTFSSSNLPTTPTNRLRPGNSYQVSHTWVASRNIVNATKVNASWNGQRIPPVGVNWERETHGFQFPQLYEGGTIPDGIPNVDLAGFANFRGPHFSLLSPTTDIAIDNTTTWIKGNHQLKGGAKYIRNRKDQNGRPTYLGGLNFSTGGNPNTSGFSVADMLLGNFRTYSEASDDPVGFFRFNQYEAFASDNWRVNEPPEPRAGRALPVRAADLQPAEQPGELRSVALRPGAGRADEQQRHDRRRLRATASTAWCAPATGFPRTRRDASTW